MLVLGLARGLKKESGKMLVLELVGDLKKESALNQPRLLEKCVRKNAIVRVDWRLSQPRLFVKGVDKFWFGIRM